MSNKSFENTFTDNDDFNIPKYDDDVSVSENNNVSAVNNSEIDDDNDYESNRYGNQEKTELNTFKDSGDIASNLFNLYQDKHVYKDFGIELDLTRGLTDTMTSRLNAGKKNVSILNKLHLIKLAGNYPAMETDIPKHSGFFEPKTVIDLCMMNRREDAVRYDLDDFV